MINTEIICEIERKNMKILSLVLASMLVGSAYGIAQEAPAPEKQNQKPVVTENQRGPRGPMNGQGFRGGPRGKQFNKDVCPACKQPIIKRDGKGPKGPMRGQGFRGGMQQGQKGPRGPMMNGQGPRSGGPNCPFNK